MTYAYLFAAIAGLLLLTVSLFGGGDHDSDGDGVSDVSDGDGDAEGHGEAFGALGAFLSVRLWTFLLGFGGITGLALRFFAHVPEPWTALLSVTSGLLAAALSSFILRRALNRPAAGARRTASLVGRSARVLIPPSEGGAGKIRVQIDGATVDLIATTDDTAGLSAREEVLIVEVRDGSTAHVTRSPVQTSSASKHSG